MYDISRDASIIKLKITKNDVIEFYIEKYWKWFKCQNETKPPPHPFSLIDQVTKDLAVLLDSEAKLNRYSRSFREDSSLYNDLGVNIFQDNQSEYGVNLYSFEIDTKETGEITFSCSGDFFKEVFPNWKKSVLEYNFSQLKTKQKHRISFSNFNAYTNDPSLLSQLKDIANSCLCNPRHFLIRFSRYSAFLYYACPICGKTYLCDCFKGLQDLWLKNNLYGFREYKKILLNSALKKGICHVCRGEIPPPIFINKIYASFFMQRYAPWVYKDVYERFGLSGYISLKSNEIRESENILREKLGVYKIGEKWVSETAMYHLIRTLVGDRFEVIHHARPAFLNGMEYDVFIPQLHLAFEYDGVQHERAVDFFGGEKSFKKTKERDKAKNEISAKERIRLVRAKDSVTVRKFDAIIKEQESKFSSRIDQL